MTRALPASRPTRGRVHDWIAPSEVTAAAVAGDVNVRTHRASHPALAVTI